MPEYAINSKTQSWYGIPIGILILNASYPCIPGNVGNATSFPFPVRYKQVSEASIQGLLHNRDPALLQPFIKGAQELEAEGVRAIAGACGFMALFQREIADAVRIPVAMSSLLLIPFIRQILPRGKRLGIITANSEVLTKAHFQAVGVQDQADLVLQGMQHCQEFKGAVLEEKGTLNSEIMEQEVLNVAKEMTGSNQDIGAVLLECSDLPPFASAVQQAVSLPVFDFITMIKLLHSAVVQQSYQGHM